jgi:hypothetical protein
MGEILTVEDIRRSSGWREALEERQNYEHERRKRELAEARKAREVEQKPQAATRVDVIFQHPRKPTSQRSFSRESYSSE